MLIASGLGLFLHRRVFDRWTLWAFGLLGIVGLGSVAFHATLRFEFQMLDELPMLYFGHLDGVPASRARPEGTRSGGPSCCAWQLRSSSAAADAFTGGRIQFFAFQLVFGGLEMFCLFRVYLLSREPRNEPVRSLFRAGVAFYIRGIVLWSVDLASARSSAHSEFPTRSCTRGGMCLSRAVSICSCSWSATTGCGEPRDNPG